MEAIHVDIGDSGAGRVAPRSGSSGDDEDGIETNSLIKEDEDGEEKVELLTGPALSLSNLSFTIPCSKQSLVDNLSLELPPG